VLKVPEPDPLGTGDTPSRASQRSKRQQQIERVFAGGAVVAVVAVIAGFSVYVVNADGAARISALFAGGLVLVGVWLLLWSYIRRPPPGQTDDFLDKFLAGVGEALLLGAVLSFGFGIVGQRLDSEQKTRDEQRAAEQAAADLRRDLAGQIRNEAGGRSFRGVDLKEQSFVGLNLSGFDLLEADMSGADLTGADLTDALLAKADMSGAVLLGADLTSANLAIADMSGAVLDGAKLNSAHLDDANLTGAFLNGADQTDATLRGADLDEADLTDANLTGSLLTNATLTGALYNAHTLWPNGFEPPPTAELV
jgi:uncharacterized protein YjbI with pentapeptide repeats